MKAGKNIAVIIAEDNTYYREGLIGLLNECDGIELVAAARDGEELYQLATTHGADVIVTDVQMPKLDGIAVTKMLVAEKPGIRIIALSLFGDEEYIVEMVAAGAKGYLDKCIESTELLTAIITVNLGRYYYCPDTTERVSKMMATSRIKPAITLFSDHELEIIALICQEFSTKEIAARIFLSHSTVETYLHRIHEKMGVKNRAGMIRFAVKHGLVKNIQP